MFFAMLRSEKNGHVTTVVISRADVRNAVDRATAEQLADAFRAFDEDPDARVAVLYGEGGNFCAGADLKAIGSDRMNRVEEGGDGPMGPSRILLSKPVIAAIEGYAVAGGIELAAWCDLRVAARDAKLGVLCRRWGVPLIDGGTIRLPRLIGLSNALDLILTGRLVDAEEAQRMGLVNRVCEKGAARVTAEQLAREIAALPQECMRNDRLSAYEQSHLSLDDALLNELRLGMKSLASQELAGGVARFVSGEGRGGRSV
jgi:enoyl-CoA hydratase